GEGEGEGEASCQDADLAQEHLHKLLVFNNEGIDKTSFKHYMHQNSSHYQATIGMDFVLKVLHWNLQTLAYLAHCRSRKIWKNDKVILLESMNCLLSSISVGNYF
uniref:Uncharacterized protein n=2 Tax=Canis lupus familiaris TaxID=9615 RepID=A0A8C0RNR8_CANLF